MNASQPVRDSFYATVAAAALSVLCLAAFTPAAPKAQPAPAVVASLAVAVTPVAMVERAPAAVTSLSVEQADLELVGASIANFDR